MHPDLPPYQVVSQYSATYGTGYEHTIGRQVTHTKLGSLSSSGEDVFEQILEEIHRAKGLLTSDTGSSS